MKDKIHPHDLVLEKQILSSALMMNNSVPLICSLLFKDCFLDEKNAVIFDSISDLYFNGIKIDFFNVAERIKKIGKINLFEDGGIYVYFSEMGNAPNISDFERSCYILIELYLRRKQIEIYSSRINQCFDQSVDVFDTLNKTSMDIMDISEKSIKQTERKILDIVIENVNTREKRKKNEVLGISTGFDAIDRTLDGLKKDNLIVVAARPAMGKTAFALNLLNNIAVEQKIPVAFFSLEMSANQLVARLSTIKSGVDANKIKFNCLTLDENKILLQSDGVISESPIFINEKAGLNISEIRSLASIMKHKHGIQCLIIDYLQLISNNGSYKGNREAEISDISRKLKIIAKDLSIPVIALSQLSRAVESRADKRPMLSDLRESGAIEQDADSVLMLFRPEYYEIKETQMQNGEIIPTDNICFVNVQKNRDGSTADIPMYFFGNNQRFEEKKY